MKMKNNPSFKNTETFQLLKKLIKDGENLTKQIQEINTLYPQDYRKITDLHIVYWEWLKKVKIFLKKHKNTAKQISLGIFNEDSDVLNLSKTPSLTGKSIIILNGLSNDDIESKNKGVKIKKIKAEKILKNLLSELKRQLKALRRMLPDKKQKLKGFPYKIPEGTDWPKVVIEFIDTKNVIISVTGHKHKTNYKEMGFEDERNSGPNIQWLFLCTLAGKQGEISSKDPEYNPQFKKAKQSLSESMKKYFRIPYHLFDPYHSSFNKEKKSYKIRVILISPKRKKDFKKELSFEDEIKEHFEEQTKII